MSWFGRYFRSSIGAKQTMAVTGLLLLLFAIFHMLGHLQMFGGQDMYNAYAHFLQDLWEVKWPTRIGLLVLLLIHLAVGIRLAAANRGARDTRYTVFRPVISRGPGRTMAWTGLIVFAFLTFHILHFTLGQVQPGYFHHLDPKNRYDAYSMFVYGFQNAGIYVSYLIGIGLLSLHLGHGASSWLQSLGWRHPKYKTDSLGAWVSVLLFFGYMIPPTAVLVGIIRLPGA
ncbi:MAG TPA: succinate dehydrogenase cytochrome b subunit [Vicinamibacterales bacterium]|nr:succinate dehydrogenase cytochrome b subunit [Vicinamibacterales bacterium]